MQTATGTSHRSLSLSDAASVLSDLFDFSHFLLGQFRVDVQLCLISHALLGDSGVYQTDSNSVFLAVFLYPELAVTQFHMNPYTMDMLEVLPAFIHEKKLPVFSIKDGKGPKSLWERIKASPFAQNSFQHIFIG